MAALKDQFFVTGGDVNGAPRNAISPTLRGLNILTPYSSSIDQYNQYRSGQKVWLLIPGFTNKSDYLDPTVGAAINNANPNDVVLALDWTQVSGSPVVIGAAGVLTGDLYRSASWITPVATAVREKLFNWGMPASALNMIQLMAMILI